MKFMIKTHKLEGMGQSYFRDRCAMKKSLRYWHRTAAAAKSHQSCPALCNPIDGGPPGSCPWESPGKKEYWSGLPFPSPV